MGAALGLIAGVGLWLVYQAYTQPQRARPPRVRRGLSQLLASAGVSSVSAAALLALMLLSAAFTALVLLAVSRTAPVAALFGLSAGYAPIALLRGRARKRRRELAEVWPEAVDNLASAVRAGLSLPEALTQLGDRGPTVLRPAFASFGSDYLSTGRFDDCLDRLKAALADPVGDRVVEGLRIARAVGGGDLGSMLRSLSRFLRDDAGTRTELEARQSWVVNGARLAAAAPWAVLLVLSTQREVIVRYRSPAGMLVLVAGAAACFVAYRFMLRIGRLPDEHRVLV